jgi:hypothetical protein
LLNFFFFGGTTILPIAAFQIGRITGESHSTQKSFSKFLLSLPFPPLSFSLRSMWRCISWAWWYMSAILALRDWGRMIQSFVLFRFCYHFFWFRIWGQPGIQSENLSPKKKKKNLQNKWKNKQKNISKTQSHYFILV